MLTITAQQFNDALQAGGECLARHRDLANALNVFPVPDGDTGTNMLLTFRAGLERLASPAADNLGTVAADFADGLFWGARGNSGVILSQFFKGFCQALEPLEIAAVSDIAAAFGQGAKAAYQAVGQPVEGTMLSVASAVARSAQPSEPATEDVATLWESAFRSSGEALALTPTQLPVLAQAGVVDAGGLGLVAILGGMWAGLTGQDSEAIDREVVNAAGGDRSGLQTLPAVDAAFVDASHHEAWGYCTQFLVEGPGLAVEQMRQDLDSIGQSVVVVGDERRARVHLHALDPGPALSYAVSLGGLSQIEIENMNLQNQEWGNPSATAPAQPLTVVAVAPGDGFEALFREAGCAAVIRGGQTMNPSVQDFVDAAGRSRGEEVILLPNNKNVVVAAELAAQGDDGRTAISVVPTVSVPQGVAAVLAFNPAESLERNIRAMETAAKQLSSIEIAPAVRDSTVGGVHVSAGQFIGIIDGDLKLAANDAGAALMESLAAAGLSPDLIVTLYWGEGSSQAQAEELAEEIERNTPGIQVDVIYGGQPHSPYLASIE